MAGLPALQRGESGQVRKEAATATYCKCRGLGSPPNSGLARRAPRPGKLTLTSTCHRKRWHVDVLLYDSCAHLQGPRNRCVQEDDDEGQGGQQHGESHHNRDGKSDRQNIELRRDSGENA